MWRVYLNRLLRDKDHICTIDIFTRYESTGYHGGDMMERSSLVYQLIAEKCPSQLSAAHLLNPLLQLAIPNRHAQVPMGRISGCINRFATAGIMFVTF